MRLQRPRTTLRNARGARPLVVGPIWIDPEAPGAQLYGLRLTTDEERYSTPLKVQADDVTIRANRITAGPSTSCIQVGSVRTTSRTLIEGNLIRACGKRENFDHGLYMQSTRDAVIRWNVIHGSRGGWGVHLYPDADHTLVAHNVIDSNVGGVVFAGQDGDGASDRNVVRNNSITLSAPRWNLEGSWGNGRVGQGNHAELNCLFSVGPGAPSGIGERSGFEERDNTVLTRPPYRGRSYVFRAGSPCRSLVGDVPARLAP